MDGRGASLRRPADLLPPAPGPHPQLLRVAAAPQGRAVVLRLGRPAELAVHVRFAARPGLGRGADDGRLLRRRVGRRHVLLVHRVGGAQLGPSRPRGVPGRAALVPGAVGRERRRRLRPVGGHRRRRRRARSRLVALAGRAGRAARRRPGHDTAPDPAPVPRRRDPGGLPGRREPRHHRGEGQVPRPERPRGRVPQLRHRSDLGLDQGLVLDRSDGANRRVCWLPKVFQKGTVV